MNRALAGQYVAVFFALAVFMQSGGLWAAGGDVSGDGSDQSFILSAVLFQGVTRFSSLDLLPMYEQMLGQQVDRQQMENLASELKQKYTSVGHTGVAVSLLAQSLASGVVRIKVTEGGIASVRIQGVSGRTAELAQSYAEQLSFGEVVDEEAVQRTRLLINDLPGISVVMRPQALEGSPSRRELLFELSEKKFAAKAYLNNRGSKITGPVMTGIDLQGFSLLGQRELLRLQGTTSSDGDELRYMNLSADLPFGDQGMKIQTQGAVSRAQPGGHLAVQDIDVDARWFYLGLRWPAIRTYRQSLFINAGVGRYSSDVDVADKRLLEDRLRYWQAGSYYTRRFGDGHFLGAGIGYVTSFSGNRTDELNEGVAVARGLEDYRKLTAHLSYNHSFSADLWLTLAARYQHSSDRLPAREKIAFGGGDYGRAYDAGELSGDRGAAFRSELRHRPDWALLRSSQSWLYGFYDIGEVEQADSDASTSAASAGLGWRARYDNWKCSVELAKPLTRDVFQEANDGDQARLFARLSYEY